MPDQTNAPDQHDHDKRVHELFMQVIDLPQQEQRAFLDKACGDDTDLCNDVLELLRFNEQQTKTVADHKSSSDRSQRMTLARGETIGSYTIIDALGEGGFGVVYLAKQTTPVKRLVALKIIKPGMDTKAVIARFEAERQALAMMDHSSIARVFEAGATPEGRPYFAMEFVKGEPINAYCDRHKLDTQARLNLFAQVCDAIQHAHQKGVIHRDLKPGNILVTIDARDEPQPKVIDFGIAKATSQSLTEKTLHTQQGQLIGTPEYMSPEQAEMSAVDVDTRSDVYSLGVILYELLSGKLPFDPEALRDAGYAEIQRIIREDDPPKPSTKLTTVHGEEATRIADARKTKLAELQSTLRRELEWIPLKALRKERTERYSSAEDLGSDVRRYLNGEPLEAGPESASYRFRKLVRRNKGPFIAAALIALALIAGIIGTTIFAVEAARAKTEAQHQAREAQEATIETLETAAELEIALQESIDEARRTRTTLGFLGEMLTFDPVEAQGLDTNMVKRMLVNAEQRLNEENGNQPLVEAGIRYIIGNSYLGLTMLKEAEPHLRKALEIREELRPPDHIEVLESKYNMGLLYKTQGRYAEAEPYYRQALDGYRRIHGDEHEDTLWTLTAIGKLLQDGERYLEAEKVYRESLETSRLALGDDARHTITAMSNLGDLFYILARYDEARDLYHEAHNASMSLYGSRDRDPDPRHMRQLANIIKLIALRGEYDVAELMSLDVLKYNRKLYGPQHYRTLISLQNVGHIITKRGRYRDAEPYFRDAMESSQRVLGNKHKETQQASLNLADNLRLQAKYDEAETLYRKVLAANPHNGTAQHMMGDLSRDRGRYGEAMMFYVEAIFDVENEHGHESIFMVEPVAKQGHLFIDTGQYKLAEVQLRKAEQLLTKRLNEDHPRVLDVRSKIAELRLEQGRYDEVFSILQKVLDSRRNVLGNEHPDTLGSIRAMGVLLQNQGKYDEAMPYYTEDLELSRRILGNEHPDTLGSINNMGNLLAYQGKHDEAIAYITEALETRRRTLGDEHPDTLASILTLGAVFWKQGKYDEALPYLTKALETRRRVLGREHPDTLQSIHNMGAVLWRQGKYDEAVPYFTEALEGRRRTLGNEHPSTLTSIGAMGVVLLRQGKTDEALVYATEAIEGNLRVLGRQHPATLLSIRNMSNLLLKQGRYIEAASIFSKGLPTHEPALLEDLTKQGDQNRDEASKQRDAAQLAKQDKYDEVLPYYIEALEVSRRTLGDEHPDTLLSIKSMIKLHDAWHEAEPDGGHDATAAQYRAQLEDLTQKDQENVTTVVP